MASGDSPKSGDEGTGQQFIVQDKWRRSGCLFICKILLESPSAASCFPNDIGAQLHDGISVCF